jgi:hypothetical protein
VTAEDKPPRGRRGAKGRLAHRAHSADARAQAPVPECLNTKHSKQTSRARGLPVWVEDAIEMTWACAAMDGLL